MRLTSLIGNKHLTLDKNSDGPRGVTRRGIFATFLFAATLAFAPLPAFAQHGGGGGGGGSHGGGGGGGGGSHASGGGSHATGSGAGSGSGSAHAPASNAGASGGNAGTSANHWWNPFHGGSTASSAHPGTNGTASGDHPNAERFAAGNNSWQEPPARGMRGTTTPGAGNNVRGAATNPRPAVSGPPHIPVIPRRPIVFAPFFPFFPGFGFGFGGLYYGAFGPCDPFWGCYGYGYGYNGMGYGYYGGGFSSGYGADLSYSGAEDNSPSEDMTQSSDTIPSLLAPAPDTSQEQEAANAGPATRPVTAVLYLKDGSSYAVTDYWLADGKIHYITSYGGENSIDQSALDLQRTVNENAAQGMTFTLRPASGATSPQ
jgi:hypothetical protein